MEMALYIKNIKNITSTCQRNWDRRPISSDLGQRYTRATLGKALKTPLLLSLLSLAEARLPPLLI